MTILQIVSYASYAGESTRESGLAFCSKMWKTDASASLLRMLFDAKTVVTVLHFFSVLVPTP